MKRKLFFILLVLGILGIWDASYLTYEHYSNIIPPCTINHFLPFFSDCGLVLRSQYAVIFGIPLALLGLIHYTILTLVIGLAIIFNKKLWWFWTFFQSVIGAFFSLYLMYLQIFVIQNICIYCTGSALISFLIFLIVFFNMEYERKYIASYKLSILYRYIVKPIFFLIDPEIVHNFMVAVGEFFGKITFIKKTIGFFLDFKHAHLKQNISGIDFHSPIGLAAGFDYNASLTQILSSIGFGFQSVGTITNQAYDGNPKPMLGRLPKSRSLMVNKGFKNKGAEKIVEKLKNIKNEYPFGISIGKTNTPLLKTQKESINDIVKTFEKFEGSNVKNAYYELNISCPNLIFGKNISFYPPKNLTELLDALEKVNIKKPIFIKMPIEKSNDEFLSMLEVIKKYRFVKGVVIGNLQKNRTDPVLDPCEVKQWKVGNFSGKPCEQRSNELIKLTYQKYKKKLIIIGCGGIFSAVDAYKKIKLGASLVQLITGMIYEGPSLIAQINFELVELLKKDGYRNIQEAVGTMSS
jgi:dihydroorotate dehydrogenase